MICNKIGYYLLRFSKVKLMRMSVEFCKDDFGQIWFIFADKIWTLESNEELQHEYHTEKLTSMLRD